MRAYRILTVLGSGGMSHVYQALVERADGETDLVAIKIPNAACLDAGHRELFLREAHTAFQHNHDHPNLVTVTDYGETKKGIPFLVMEFIDGGTAGELCEQEPLEPAMVGHVAHVLLQALAYLHGCGVLHHDITPGNILFSRTGQIKLSDFGLARRSSASSSSSSGFMRGTPAYASPEQLRGERLTEASDLFSLGAVLYMLLTTRAPFGETEPAVILRCMQNSRPALPKDTPAELRQLILGLLEIEATQRLTLQQALDLTNTGKHSTSSDDVAVVVQERLGTKADKQKESAKVCTVPDMGPPDLVVPPAIDLDGRSHRTRWPVVLTFMAVIAALLASGYAFWSIAHDRSSPSVAIPLDQPVNVLDEGPSTAETVPEVCRSAPIDPAPEPSRRYVADAVSPREQPAAKIAHTRHDARPGRNVTLTSTTTRSARQTQGERRETSWQSSTRVWETVRTSSASNR